MKLSFRTKLLGVVVPALVVLLVLGIVVVRDGRDDAAGARNDRRKAELALAAMSVRDELQTEARLAMLVLNNSDGTGRQEFDSQIVTTNSAALALSDILARSGDTAEITEAKADLLHVTNDELPLVRNQVAPGAGGRVMGGVTAIYDDVVVDMSSTAVHFAGSASSGQLASQSVELVEIITAKDAYSVQLLEPLKHLNGAVVGIADGAVYLETANETKRSFDRLLALSRPDSAAAIQAFTDSDLASNVRRRGEEYATAGATNRVPRLTGPEWLALASGAAAGLDQIEDALFEQYLVRADTLAGDANRRSIMFTLLTAFGLFAAVAGALLVGRSLSRRLAAVTTAAHSIATERLPEVLEALRNPTAEAVAAAVPEIPSQGTDEVGQLADDFNRVLRTAVETSIEHSQRRAATLTNLLVNLGRRNQALIDRQLELVDQLESDQPDQKTLAGLFRLDHMITRQRRNAESLLVLAGSRRSRSWTDSLPISDVLQGAISEVAQMDRVALEIQPGNDLVFGGSHAVDLSHLIAELVENATAYSSPATRVTVRVQRSATQFRIWIIDAGVGMADDEVESANTRVTSPPDIDEIATDQVGFQVVGRLALRIGARVRLQNNPAGGVAVSVDLPMALFDNFSADARRRADAPVVQSDGMTGDTGDDLSWAELAFDDDTRSGVPAPISLEELEASIPDDVLDADFFDVAADVEPPPGRPGVDLPRRERRQESTERPIRQLLPNGRPGQGPRPGVAAAMIGDRTMSAEESIATPLARRSRPDGAGSTRPTASPATASGGLFGRLPSTSAANDDDAALARRRNLSNFTRAVELAREDVPDDQDGVQP